MRWLVSTQCSKKGQPVSRRLGHGHARLIDACEKRNLAHLLQFHRKATVPAAISLVIYEVSNAAIKSATNAIFKRVPKFVFSLKHNRNIHLLIRVTMNLVLVSRIPVGTPS